MVKRKAPEGPLCRRAHTHTHPFERSLLPTARLKSPGSRLRRILSGLPLFGRLPEWSGQGCDDRQRTRRADAPGAAAGGGPGPVTATGLREEPFDISSKCDCAIIISFCSVHHYYLAIKAAVRHFLFYLTEHPCSDANEKVYIPTRYYVYVVY